MLDVEKLATLRAVLDHGSFSAAAGSLGLTQPAISRQIALLERQAGAQLVVRSRRGVQATEAGRVLYDHADAILRRLSLAERQLADLTGLRRGDVVLGSFFTALTYLSAEACAWLSTHHPGIVVRDELVDRRTAFERLGAGELDAAIVFEHRFEPDPPPNDVDIVPLFDDPARVLLPSDHPLATTDDVSIHDLRHDTWIRPHDGSAARLVDEALQRHGLHPPLIAAGRGDEPVEAQALVAAGKAVMVAHELNVIINPGRIAVRAPRERLPERRIQAAILHEQQGAAPRTVFEALRAVARKRTTR